MPHAAIAGRTLSKRRGLRGGGGAGDHSVLGERRSMPHKATAGRRAYLEGVGRGRRGRGGGRREREEKRGRGENGGGIRRATG